MKWFDKVIDWLFKPRGVDKPEDILVDVGKGVNGKQLFLHAGSKRQARVILNNRNLALDIYYEGKHAGMRMMNEHLETLLKKKKA